MWKMDEDMDEASPYRELARQMVERQIRARGIHDERVLDALGSVPRHEFVPLERRMEAYADMALPTAEGQTISQPYMVAIMTALLDVQPGQKVLEIGTGSGYQTAILARLGAQVVSVERSAILARQAQATLKRLGLDGGVHIHQGDGTLGWPGDGPYHRVLVTAGAPHLPKAYQAQVIPGGRVVIPIGDRHTQQLVVFVRQAEGWSSSRGIQCCFVPLCGEDGWAPEGA